MGPFRRTAALGAVFAVVLVAAACSRGGVDSVRVQRPETVTAPTIEHPLTGLPSTGKQAWQSRSPLAVKVENIAAARPQAGLDKADVVFEELAEGGITRFIAIFHSQEAPRIGPVRSARMVDPDVLAPYGALFAYSGGVAPVLAAVRAQRSITDVGVDRVPDAYQRVSGRPAPHNLYTSTAGLWRGREGKPSAAQFTFVPQGAPAPAGQPGNAASFSFAPGESMSFEYDAGSGKYLRSHGPNPHMIDGGGQASATNVLFQVVRVTAGSIRDVNGQPTPEASVMGEGEVILLRGGYAFPGRWIRSDPGSPPKFVDAAGQPLLFGRGNTWIELVPSGRSIAVS